MNLTAAQAELSDRYGADDLATARLTTFLNDAKNQFEDYPFDWPWLKATTTGASPLTISDLKRVLYVVDSSNKVELVKMEQPDIIGLANADLTFGGPPSFWYLSAETVLSCFPATSTSLSVRYVKFSPELSSGSDTPLIPVRYHSAWIDIAGVAVLKDREEWQQAAALQGATDQRMAQIAALYAMQDVPERDSQLITYASDDW